MGIFSRLGDIVNSNLNAILDRAEDPAKMIRNIIQEMEDTLIELRTAAAKVIAEKKQLQRQQQLLAKQAATWQEKAEVALKNQREDLAKAALLKKSSIAEATDAAIQQVEFFDEDMQKYQEDIAHLQDKINEARNRQQRLLRRRESANHKLKVQRVTANDRIEKVLSNLDKFERDTDFIEASADAENLGQHKTLEQEISDLDNNEKVSDELTKLKARLAQDDKGE